MQPLATPSPAKMRIAYDAEPQPLQAPDIQIQQIITFLHQELRQQHRMVDLAATPTDPKLKAVDLLVPNELPLSFDSATEEDNEKGHEIKATLANRYTNKVRSLAYQTYEFDPTGNLVRVEGGIKQVDLEAGKQATLSIIPQRPSNPKNRLMLALEKAFGDKESWSASHLDLANAGAERANGKTPTQLAGKKDKDVVGEDFASGFCINAYRRAVQLAEVGGKTPPTSFTCDQTGRAYAYSFPGKTLVK